MKRWLVFLIIFISIGAVIFGRFSYQAKLSDIAEAAKEHSSTPILQAEDNAASEPEENNGTDNNESSEINIAELTGDLDSSIRDLIEGRYAEDEKIEVAAFGSRALTDSENEGLIPWPELLEENLNESYGTELFEITIYSFDRLTSLEVYQDSLYEEAAVSQPDLLILEPFMLSNNGNVRIEDSLDITERLIEEFERENEDIIVLVQPAPPLYNSVFYPQEVEELKNFAEETGLTYIDHWEEWPGIQEDELLNYSVDRQGIPTEAGHELWAEALKKYFVNE
ncbi:SGNH/GDSL hydrolase family protein [Evansella sp. LMS18]|uniref:SGNH/GDSL hydrolase family protein n=1 Tax=Evansella sp. LMS18 TaxID=2924033 RepID=UPI0020D066AE|nr:SGNH/GDSL hydrolase family protein [Evansella sp. LMS18]UTR11818.1 SGNH/GDSL hydrolase family protein [Evansella sp. LMS18]